MTTRWLGRYFLKQERLRLLFYVTAPVGCMMIMSDADNLERVVLATKYVVYPPEAQRPPGAMEMAEIAEENRRVLAKLSSDMQAKREQHQQQAQAQAQVTNQDAKPASE